MSKRTDEQWAFLLNLSRLIEFIRSAGYTATGGELWRTPEQQAVYVKTGRSRTMNSKHLDRLAIDLNIFKDGKLLGTKAELQVFGDYWQSLDPVNVWGGNWKGLVDTLHFERNAS